MKLIFIPLSLFILLLCLSNCSHEETTHASNASNNQADTLLTVFQDSSYADEVRAQIIRYYYLDIGGDQDSAYFVADSTLSNLRRPPKDTLEIKYVARMYVSRAYCLKEFGDFNAAKKDYLEAMNLFQEIGQEDHYVGRFVYEQLGNIYTRQGENRQAIRLLKEFKRIEESQEEIQYDALSDAHNDLGRAYMNKGDFNMAGRELFEGIVRCKGRPNEQALLYSSMAETNLLRGEIESGIRSGKKSLELFERLKRSGEEHNSYKVDGYIAGTQNVMGLLHIKADQLDIANDYLQKALSISQGLYRTKHRKIAKIYCAMGDCHYAAKDYLSAAEDYQMALILSMPDFNDETVTSLPKDNDFIPEVTIGEALRGKARAFYQMGIEENDDHWRKQSLNTYFAYFEWENKLRSEQQDFESKLIFSTEIHQIGEEALDVAYSLKDRSTNIGRKALNIMYQSNAIVLSENNARLLSTDNNIQKYTQELRNLSLQLSEAEKALKFEVYYGEAEEVKRLQKVVTETDKLLQITKYKIREAYPDYDRLIEQNELPEKELLSYLENNKANLINFFQGKTFVYTVAIDHGDYFFERTPAAEVQQSSETLLESLQNPRLESAPEFQKTSNKLYESLFGKVKSKLNQNNWVIIPDGNINSLPLEALVTDPIAIPSYKKLKYLLLKRTIHYAPSIEKILTVYDKSTELENYLGVAPDFSAKGGFPNLQFARDEALHGATIFNGSKETQYKTSKRHFIDKAEEYRVLHISTHTGVDSTLDKYAWLAFSDSDQSEEYFRGVELLQLQLNSDLVVLNACQTGSGEYVEGEGVMSFSRGFMDAGARNVLTNLWSVNHTTNHAIIKGFYDEIPRAENPAEALRESKLTYLRNSNTDELQAHPYFWSPMVLLGNNQPLKIEESPKSWSWIWYLVLIVPLTIGARYFFFRRPKQHLSS